ncbi:MAG: hypothetical protein M3R53_06870 [Candidatus Eremiobacteraeota bacterium]|nr:hypothetical protein [Candidatus Eremiobacteraeota bacterium]
MGLVDTFEAAVCEIPAQADFRDIEIVARRARRSGRSVEFALTLDRPGGMDMGLCERVAAYLNAALDAETDPYTLEVESAGIDRPLLHPSDYERFRERDVVVTTSLPLEHEYTHHGKLLGIRGNAVVLGRTSGELSIPLDAVKTANIEYDYRADLRRAKRERREKR